MRETKRVQVGYARQSKGIIIEFPGGRVHVTTGLRTAIGRDCVHVSVEANGNRFAGEPEYWLAPTECGDQGAGLRIIQDDCAQVFGVIP